MNIKKICAVLILISITCAAADDGWERAIVNLDRKSAYDENESGIRNITFIDDSTGWLLPRYFSGVLRTDDGGKTWKTLPSNIEFRLTNSASFVTKDKGWLTGQKWDEDVVDDEDRRIWSVILSTDDGGITWKENKFLKGIRGGVGRIYFVDENHGWAGGIDAETDTIFILSTTDGGKNWQIQYEIKSDVYSFAGINNIGFSDANNGWLVSRGVFRTVDGGKSWSLQKINEQSLDLFGLSVIDKDNAWTVGQCGVVYKTTDGGNNWVKVVPIDEAENAESHWVSVKFIDKNRGWIGGTEGQVLFTEDGGLTWARQYLPKRITDGGTFSASVIAITSSKVFVAGNNDTVFSRPLVVNKQ